MDMISAGVSITIVGLTIVFSVLILISLIISLLGRIVPKSLIKETKQDVAVNTVVTKPTNPVPTVKGVDEQLIAVISAVLSDHLNVSSSSFIVKSIKKVNSWNEAAKRDHQN